MVREESREQCGRILHPHPKLTGWASSWLLLCISDYVKDTEPLVIEATPMSSLMHSFRFNVQQPPSSPSRMCARSQPLLPRKGHSWLEITRLEGLSPLNPKALCSALRRLSELPLWMTTPPFNRLGPAIRRIETVWIESLIELQHTDRQTEPCMRWNSLRVVS